MWIVRKSPTDSEADQLLELGGLKLAERLKGLHQDDLDLQKSAKELMKMLNLIKAQTIFHSLQNLILFLIYKK